MFNRIGKHSFLQPTPLYQKNVTKKTNISISFSITTQNYLSIYQSGACEDEVEQLHIKMIVSNYLLTNLIVLYKNQLVKKKRESSHQPNILS